MVWVKFINRQQSWSQLIATLRPHKTFLWKLTFLTSISRTKTKVHRRTKTFPVNKMLFSEIMEGDKMLEKVVCPFYSVGQCKFKDQCLREHHKEDCKDSLCRRKGCPKRHRRPCRYGNICKIYNKDKSCEFRHYFIDLDKNNKTYESVTNQLKDSKELVLKLRLEILELEKLNKEKVLLIDDLSFKIANTVLPNDEETWYDCNETDQLKSDFSHLSSKYNELLSELADPKTY